MVYVLDRAGKPLMPTKRHGKIKWLLRNKQAKVVKRSPFTIQLLYEPEKHCTQPATLGVDAGSRHIGLSVSTEKNELFSAEMTLRDDIPQLMAARRQARRIRRSHLRYRPARFDNRRRLKGWLTPTMEAKVRAHVNVINDVCSILPVSRIIIETASFDIQKIKDPVIEGAQYQQGEQLGYENVKAYVKARDGFSCWKCGSKEKLEVHHIKQRKDGGPDRPDNLVTLCHDCHAHHHDGTHPLSIPSLGNKGFRNATEMSTMRWFLLDKVKKAHPDITVEQTYGYVTNWKQKHLGLEKSHANDAFCVVGNLHASRCDDIYDIAKIRCHNRKLCKDNLKKEGKRQSQQGPRYIRGYQRYDICLHDEKVALVTARKSDGRLNLKYTDETIVKYVQARKTVLVEHAKTKIYMKRMPHSSLMPA